MRVIGLVLCLLVAGTATRAFAQSAAGADALETRIARARALAAAHRLASAAAELDAIRHASTDESVRDVACMMLMNIYLEDGDYTRAEALLSETFKARTTQNESSVQSYFALAGQTINGARAHLERYRTFGINVSDKGLPNEAKNDLDGLRQLMEHIAEQSTNISNDDPKHTDGMALLEDVASVRAALGRDDEDRARWQQEFESARQKLAASETRIASIGVIPGRSVGTPARPNSPADSIQTEKTSNVVPASSSSTSNTKHANAARPAKSAEESGNGSTASSASRQGQPSGNTPDSNPGSPSGGNAPASDQIVEVGSLLDKAVQKVNPTYPPTAKNVRVSGVVTVYVLVNENGLVETVQRSNGPQLLRQSAIDAARRWKFRPTLKDGQPVRVAGYISFNFTL